MKIIVIIVTYNGLKWVEKCFSSLTNSNIPLKILAIDNSSTDGTPKIIRKKFPRVKIIETGENLGFGKANNLGIKRALEEKADFVFLLNQDAWIEADTIGKLVKVSVENPFLGILSPIHLNGKGDAIDIGFQNYLSLNVTPNLLSDIVLGKTKPFYISKYANAAAWLLTNKCMSLLGGFDPQFKHYGEDDDYLNRLKKTDLKLAIVPNAKIYHDRPQDGKLNDKYYENWAYTAALLSLKGDNRPNWHFLVRNIIADNFRLYFVCLGKNLELKNKIRKNILELKLLNKV